MADPALTYRDGKVVLADREGNVGLVEPAKLQEYLGQGFTPVATGELDAAERARVEQEQLQSIGAKARTLVTSVSEGLAAPINWALGGPDQNDELFGAVNKQAAAEQAANPITAGTGRVAGELLGLKGFGASAAAARAGGLATGAVARGAITAGIEGAGLGTISAMEDPGASAEHVLASGALGAVLGAGTGTLFGFGGKALAKVFGRPVALAEETGTAESVGRAKDLYNSAVSAATKTPKELLEEVGAFGTRRAEAEAAASNIGELINTQSLEMQPLITRVDSNVDAITRRVRDSAMKEAALRKVAGESFNTEERLVASKQLVSGTKESIDPVLEALEREESEALIPAQTRKELRALRSELVSASDTAATGETDALSNYMLANGIKQKLDKVIKGLRNDVNTPKMQMSHQQASNILEIAGELQKTADWTREALESESLWGKAVAGAQKDVNAIWHSGAIRALNDFGKNFMRSTGEESYETGRLIFENDPAQTANVLRKLGTPESFIGERAMSDYIKHVGNLVETIGEKYGLKGEQRELIDTTLKQLQELKARFGAVKDTAELANKYQKVVGIEAQNRGIANSLPLLGGVLAGPGGAAVGVGLRQLMSPASTAQHMVQLARAGERIKTLTSGVGTWLSKGAEAVGATRAAKVATTSEALRLWQGKGRADNDVYSERSKAVAEADVTHVGPHLDGLPPDVQAAAGGQAARALQYLQTLLPRPAGGPTLMNPSRKVTASVPEQQKFAKAWATVVDPGTAVRDLKRGTLSPIQVQTLKTVYPRMYQELQLATLQGIAQADASGKTIPLHTRQQLALLLDLGAAQPAFSDQMVAIVQQGMAAQQQQQNQPAKHGAPRISASMRSPSQRA